LPHYARMRDEHLTLSQKILFSATFLSSETLWRIKNVRSRNYPLILPHYDACAMSICLTQTVPKILFATFLSSITLWRIRTMQLSDAHTVPKSPGTENFLFSASFLAFKTLWRMRTMLLPIIHCPNNR
jgi:hypothetical protein